MHYDEYFVIYVVNWCYFFLLNITENGTVDGISVGTIVIF